MGVKLNAVQSLELRFWPPRTPMIFQAEPLECGLACLAMIARHHGGEGDLHSLRRCHPIGGRGITLKHLVSVAGSIHLQCRALRLETDQLEQLQLPCVLHWDLDHFVVLSAVRRRRAKILDPASGPQWLDWQALERRFSGVALEVQPGVTFKSPGAVSRLTLGDVLGGSVGLYRSLSIVILLSLLLQMFALVSPLFMQLVIDEVVALADRDLLAVLAVGFALLLLVETFTTGLRQWVILALEAGLGLQLSKGLLHHLLRLPVSYFQNRSLGDVASRFAALDSIRQVFSTSVVTAIVDGLLAVVCLIVMWRYSADLTLLVLGFLGLTLGLRLALFPTLQQRSRQHIEAAASADSSFLESVRMIQTLKVQAAEDLREGHWLQRQVTATNRQVSLSRLGILYNCVSGLLSGAQSILVICVAGIGVLDGALTVGMFFAYISFKQRFCGSIDALIGQMLDLRLLRIQLDRLSDILRCEPDRLQHHGNILPLDNRTTRALALQARQLGFCYAGDDASIFRGLDLTVNPGEIVAITGASGCGKSTLLKCLAGLYEPTHGSILIDGVPRSNRVPDACRRLAAVMQDDTLFSGSLADNLTCGDENPDLQFMADCAELACIHLEIMRMPMQYSTPVGEGGAGFSGGQVQRLCLARALYRRPGLLLLDEAGSHLHPECEARINAALRRIGTTCILVAHRQESLAIADRVFRLPVA